MLTNTKLINFVNRVASDNDLRTALEADFDGTLSGNGLELTADEKASLQTSFRYLRSIQPMSLEKRVAATTAGC